MDNSGVQTMLGPSEWLYFLCVEIIFLLVLGSVILHQLSLRFDLDFFIMFSSIAGIVGNVGQLAYSAANTFLDSLCEYRRNKLGLTALSVAWGTMGGAGILERSKDIASLFQSYGFRIMSCNQGKLWQCIDEFNYSRGIVVSRMHYKEFFFINFDFC